MNEVQEVLSDHHSDEETDEGDEGVTGQPEEPEYDKTGRWRLLKRSNEIYRYFRVEFINNKKTIHRQCVKCCTVVKSIN